MIPIQSALLRMSAIALTLMIAAGCALDRTEVSALKNSGAAIEPSPLPPEIVKAAPRRASANEAASGRTANEIVLAGARQDSSLRRNGSDELSDAESGLKLESRIKVPKELPGADVPPLRLPKRTPGNEAAYYAAIRKLYPTLPEPPPSNFGPSDVPRQVLTLDELEQMALANSPVIAQYQSDVAGQVGTTIQAGAHPNPLVGYEADTVGSAGTRNYQGVYITQLIKTGGKLQLAQAIENVDLMNTQLALRQARNDLLSQVRKQYFALLIARESVRINEAVVGFTQELYRIQVDLVTEGEASAYEPDQLRVFAVQAKGALVAARNRYISAWQQLTAALNVPNLPLADLADDPNMPVPIEDYDAAVAHVLSMNTEARAARNGPFKAQLALRLAEVTPLPDLNAYATVQKDFTTPSINRSTYNLQLGVPLPIFDRNKGNILTARASLVRATEEIARVENDLRSRLADAFERYETNRVLVTYQRDQVLPDSVRAYRGTSTRHIQEQDKVGFADVVVAQQSLLNAVTQYITALNDQWAAFVDIAALLQIESLRELKLPLREKDASLPPSAPPPVEGTDAGSDVSRMVGRLLSVTQPDAPGHAQAKSADEE